MCLLGLLLNYLSPDVPFLLTHNRDEFFERPTAPPEVGATVVFGTDLRGGGTWLGLNRKTGVFVALTNAGRREKTPPGAESRGKLVIDLLHGKRVSIEELGRLSPSGTTDSVDLLSPSSSSSPDSASPPLNAFRPLDLGASFAGFNIIIAALPLTSSSAPTSSSPVPAQRPEAFFITNRPPKKVVESSLELASLVDEEITTKAAAEAEAGEAGSAKRRPRDETFCHLKGSTVLVRRVEDGAHALSNSTLNDERWAKVHWLAASLAGLKKEEESGDQWIVAKSEGTASPGAEEKDISRRELEEDLALLKKLMARVIPLVTRSSPIDSRSRMPDLSWSVIPEALERHLQESVFVKPFGGVDYGTRAITVTVQIRKTLFFLYRSFDKDKAGVEASTTVEGKAATVAAGAGSVSDSTQAVLDALSAAAPFSSSSSSVSSLEGAIPPPIAAPVISPSDAALAPATPVEGDGGGNSRRRKDGDREFGDLLIRFGVAGSDGEDDAPWLVTWDRRCA